MDSKDQSWIACAVVLLYAGFFLLLLREGNPESYQQIADSIFHNWIAMAAITVSLGVVRRWGMPRVFRILSGFLLMLSALVTGLDLIAWPPVWALLSRFNLSRERGQPFAAIVLIAVWLAACVGVTFRALIGWLGARYEHHGFALGFGPLYFYFRRRRVS